MQFIAVKMRENETWKTNNEKEFDNAVEAMEKLVMNRVYHLYAVLPTRAEYRLIEQTIIGPSFQLYQ